LTTDKQSYEAGDTLCSKVFRLLLFMLLLWMTPGLGINVSVGSLLKRLKVTPFLRHYTSG